MSSRPHILVAEDDPELLTLVADVLKRRGADVVCAQTGAELVLALANQSPFDLVLTDINMPWMDGLEAMRSVRYAGLTVPIIFITASRETSLPGRIAALGKRAMLLHKPVEPERLESAVDHMLEQRPLHRERQ